jgi:hypothetical protein
MTVLSLGPLNSTALVGTQQCNRVIKSIVEFKLI